VENAAKWLAAMEDCLSLLQHLVRRWSVWWNVKKKSQQNRIQQGKEKYPTLLLTDTQSTKNTDIQGKENTGFDGGKKIKGIKKSITVDTTGFPPDSSFIQIDTANSSERKMCKQGFNDVFETDKELINNIQKNICDGGYDGKAWKQEMKEQFDIEIEITQRTDIANGVVSKIRWISERTFAWLDKCRRLSKNYEVKPKSTKSFIVLSFIRLLVRRITGGCIKKWVKKVKVEI
jgi:transposase